MLPWLPDQGNCLPVSLVVVGLFDVDLVKFGLDLVGLAEVGLVEIDLAEFGLDLVGLAEVGLVEIDLIEKFV